MGRRGVSLVKVLVAVLFVPVVAAPAAAGTTAATSAYLVRDGVSQPIYSYTRAIRETVWVDAGVDDDRDGVSDRVAVDIVRPAEPAARGQRVPALIDTSPYYACCGRGNELQKKTYGADGKPAQFPLFYDNYFVPRGYAVLLVDMLGTNRSSGCTDGGPHDVAADKAVVNWLNGRAAGYSSVFGAERVVASWANGTAGMFGKSNDGEEVMALADTGISGLTAVVPIAGVSDPYRIFNPNGASVGPGGGDPGVLNDRAQQLCQAFYQQPDQQAGDNGDLTPYWQRRDYVQGAGRVKAAVFAVQGFGDVNVIPWQFSDWWRRLPASLPKQAWLHQGGHIDPFDLRRADYVDAVHRWFDRYVLGIGNGVERQPQIQLERAPDQWQSLPSWPPATHPLVLHPRAATSTGPGSLTPERGRGSATVLDDPALTRMDWAEDAGATSTARVVFRTEPLAGARRIAGSTSVTVTVRSDKPVARLGVEVLDLGPATIRNYPDVFGGQGIRTLTTRSCWGQSSPEDSACFLDTVTDTVAVDHEVIAYGWADVGHYASLSHQVPLDPHRFYPVTFDLTPMDHVVPAGHRLALVLAGTDGFYFGPLDADPTLTFDLGATTVRLPRA